MKNILYMLLFGISMFVLSTSCICLIPDSQLTPDGIGFKYLFSTGIYWVTMMSVIVSGYSAYQSLHKIEHYGQ